MAGSWREALKDLLLRAREDDALRDRLCEDPRGTLAAEAGIEVPPGVTVAVVEDTADIVHLVLPPRVADVGISVVLADDDLETTSGGAEAGMMGFEEGAFGAYGFQGGFGEKTS